MICLNCGRPATGHVNGVCPKLDTHVVIDADSLARAKATGHPRLLGNLLNGQVSKALTQVTILEITINGSPV